MLTNRIIQYGHVCNVQEDGRVEDIRQRTPERRDAQSPFLLNPSFLRFPFTSGFPFSSPSKLCGGPVVIKEACWQEMQEPP
jgi:hypothetical protein